ncbi:phage tail sheath subtilisin-like domain-containing protein [Cryobacterium sp. CG_9.6]|uniref:phage tail sheath family protein n=1 Tax=Cryobacterium sp. CG_9.6 TaxID=2760710 RepID=UPI0024770503|nr:phage tail sheath subtilisin-like domain-containing protein [Cryobacterium sp. CG_9.6]MDH6236118.1 phage tail sheath protein FI [Cryobacterium sp. CG_9.6]
MPNYLAPGVYVQEIPSGARAIGQVPSSIAGFVGVAPDAAARLDETVVLDNWTQFVDIFVGTATVGTPLSNAVYGFFNNGGGRCYVVNIGTGGSLLGTAAKPTGLRNFEKIDDISIVAAPGYADADSYAALIGHCEHPLRQDRVAILDAVEDYGPDVAALTRVATSGVPTKTSAKEGEEAQLSLGAPQSPGGYAAMYVPWLVVVDPVSGLRVTVPPSGHLAGVWARVDGTRGVHKAPANEPIQGAIDLRQRISRGEQEVLNPAGVNCIRYFPGEGIRVWGARTKAPEASEYRYIPVRRLTNMIKESIEDGTRWAVFEPNKDELWRSLRRDIGNFLTNVWHDGALFGTTPQQAFFVKCDAETNPPEVRDAGRVVTIIGLAPVKPAEFIVFKLMQSVDTTEIENL